MADSGDFGANLKRARKAAGWSQERLAQEADLESKGYISALETSARPIPPGRTLERLANALRVTVPDLVGGGDGPARRAVPLVGYVGAGSEAHHYAAADEWIGEVDAPEDVTDKTVAVEIRGTSLGPAFDRWLIFYDDVHPEITASHHGQLCVVGLPNDKVLVKVVRPAATPGRYHLISNTGEDMLFDQEVLWAAKVKGMKPRG